MTLATADMASSGLGEPVGGTDGGPGPRAGAARRRTFSAQFKLRIVAEYDAATGRGEKGALLRREGLYQSHITKWRNARDRGGLQSRSASSGPRVKSASAVAVEVRKLTAENARLAAELAQTKAVVEVLGKAHALLEILSESAAIPAKRPR